MKIWVAFAGNAHEPIHVHTATRTYNVNKFLSKMIEQNKLDFLEGLDENLGCICSECS